MLNNLTELLQKQLRTKKALKLNAERATKLRRQLLLNTQARKLLIEEHDRLEKEIALRDGRLKLIPANQPVQGLSTAGYKVITPKQRKTLVRRLKGTLSTEEVAQFIASLAD